MKKKSDLLGHRQRLRERFINSGIDSLHDYEALELLLTFAIPRKDVKPIAKELLRKFKNFSQVFDASIEELCEVKGIGPNAAALFLTIKAVCGEYLAEKMCTSNAVSNPSAVINYARMQLGGEKNEAFMVIFLNTKNHVIHHRIIHRGTIDHAAIYPRNIIKEAVLKHASGIIILHNHPSGICDPSQEDRRITRNLRNAASTVNIRLVDHIIVSQGGHFSFVENRML